MSLLSDVLSNPTGLIETGRRFNEGEQTLKPGDTYSSGCMRIAADAKQGLDVVRIAMKVRAFIGALSEGDQFNLREFVQGFIKDGFRDAHATLATLLSDLAESGVLNRSYKIHVGEEVQPKEYSSPLEANNEAPTPANESELVLIVPYYKVMVSPQAAFPAAA